MPIIHAVVVFFVVFAFRKTSQQNKREGTLLLPTSAIATRSCPKSIVDSTPNRSCVSHTRAAAAVCTLRSQLSEIAYCDSSALKWCFRQRRTSIEAQLSFIWMVPILQIRKFPTKIRLKIEHNLQRFSLRLFFCHAFLIRVFDCDERSEAYCEQFKHQSENRKSI